MAPRWTYVTFAELRAFELVEHAANEPRQLLMDVSNKLAKILVRQQCSMEDISVRDVCSRHGITSGGDRGRISKYALAITAYKRRVASLEPFVASDNQLQPAANSDLMALQEVEQLMQEQQQPSSSPTPASHELVGEAAASAPTADVLDAAAAAAGVSVEEVHMHMSRRSPASLTHSPTRPACDWCRPWRNFASTLHPREIAKRHLLDSKLPPWRRLRPNRHGRPHRMRRQSRLEEALVLMLP